METCAPILVLSALASGLQAKPLTLYVAPNGNDAWSGRLDAPARDAGDGPLATLPAALKSVRAARAKLEGQPDAVTIFVRGGTYEITEPVRIIPADSGPGPDRPLTICAYLTERPILSGGRRITGCRRAAGDPNRWQAEIPAVRKGGWYFRQLFVNGQRKTRARTPNQGFFTSEGEYLQDNPVKFKFRGGDIKPSWANSDAELIALHKWIDLRQFIREVDQGAHSVTLTGLIHPHTKEPNARYYIENSPDELDQAGEWYLERKTGLLTYLATPGEEPDKTEIIAPQLTSELMRFEGDAGAQQPVRHVVLRGLTFAYTDWTLESSGYTDNQAAARIRGDLLAESAVDCEIEGCTFAHLGGYAIELGNGCQRWKIVGNEIYDVGAGGIRLGTPAKAQDSFGENFGHLVTDNHLHQLGRVYAPAVGVIIFQSGANRVAHNHIHDLYYTAVSVGWNWGYQETACRENVIEFNHLHNIGQGILSDMGAVYTLGIQKGSVVRNNLIHDVNAHSYGGWGLYTDEGSTDIVLENNLVYRCKSATFHQHYGRDNILRNNVLALGTEHQLMRTREEQHNSFTFEHNLVFFESGDLLGSNWSNDHFSMDYNIYWDSRPDSRSHPLTFNGISLADWQKRGHDVHSLVADPLFVAPHDFDFRLKLGSPAFKLGFKPIDLREVGVRKKFRKQVHDTEEPSASLRKGSGRDRAVSSE